MVRAVATAAFVVLLALHTALAALALIETPPLPRSMMMFVALVALALASAEAALAGWRPLVTRTTFATWAVIVLAAWVAFVEKLPRSL